ncbi:MAG: 3-deoxy-D-manno-octulosonic acid transferase [Deltaproteobacteria bacterium]|nr:3-deoxy-D-manno-octulosonic acid transferase [Deltaproteobacteria bacterium]
MNNRLLFLYKLVSAAAGLVGWPYFFWHLKSRGQGESFWPRLGLKLPAGLRPPGYPRLWLHGVSVGEIQAAIPLVAELRNLLPRAAFIISTGTESGQMLARKHFSPQGALVCYFPLDIPWAVRRYLDCLRPQVFIGLESEIWPNFLSQAHRMGVRLALVNARLSDNSLRSFLKYKRNLSDIFNLYDIVAPGSLPDLERFQRLGISPSRLNLTGNLKYDRLLQSRDELRLQEFRGCLQGSQPGQAGGPLWLAASTHPGEEELVADAFQELLAPYPALRLVLAPRHPQRAPDLARLLARRGLPCHLWTALKAGRETRTHPVVIIDTIGDLFTLCGAADVAFVGGSLIPHGGQNILEPAAWGRAPIYGPHLENFLWAKHILEAAGAGIMVKDAAALAQAVRHLLDHPQERRELGRRAQAALIPHQGAARRQAELIAGLAEEVSS